MGEVLALALALAAEPVFLRAREPHAVESGLPHPRWLLLEPVALDYENPLDCPSAGRCDAPITYQWRALSELDGQPAVEVSAHPLLSSPGTHRLLAFEGEPPPPSPELPGLVELVVRAGDGYVGLASELIGVPFVLNPTTLPDGRHQTDARLGADCVALVIYGRRRLGERVPYVAPRGLLRFTDPVEGPVQAGDVLYYGFQTAILAEDLGETGVLDAPDRVLHTWHGLAELSTLGALPYRDAPVEPRRWR